MLTRYAPAGPFLMQLLGEFALVDKKGAGQIDGVFEQAIEFLKDGGLKGTKIAKMQEQMTQSTEAKIDTLHEMNFLKEVKCKFVECLLLDGSVTLVVTPEGTNAIMFRRRLAVELGNQPHDYSLFAYKRLSEKNKKRLAQVDLNSKEIVKTESLTVVADTKRYWLATQSTDLHCKDTAEAYTIFLTNAYVSPRSSESLKVQFRLERPAAYDDRAWSLCFGFFSASDVDRKKGEQSLTGFSLCAKVFPESAIAIFQSQTSHSCDGLFEMNISTLEQPTFSMYRDGNVLIAAHALRSVLYKALIKHAKDDLVFGVCVSPFRPCGEINVKIVNVVERVY